DFGHIERRQPRRLVKDQRALAGTGEHAIQDQRMEVQIEIQSPAESLDDHHGPGTNCPSRSRTTSSRSSIVGAKAGSLAASDSLTTGAQFNSETSTRPRGPVASSQPLQQREVSRNERFLLGACPALQST